MSSTRAPEAEAAYQIVARELRTGRGRQARRSRPNSDANPVIRYYESTGCT